MVSFVFFLGHFKIENNLVSGFGAIVLFPGVLGLAVRGGQMKTYHPIDPWIIALGSWLAWSLFFRLVLFVADALLVRRRRR